VEVSHKELNKKFQEELIAYFSFDTTRTEYKTTPPTILRCRDNVSTELLPNKHKGGHTDPQTLLSYDKDRIENDASNNSSIVAYVYVAAVTFLSNRCLAAYTYRHTG
jgi:hypothetical protein